MSRTVWLAYHRFSDGGDEVNALHAIYGSRKLALEHEPRGYASFEALPAKSNSFIARYNSPNAGKVRIELVETSVIGD